MSIEITEEMIEAGARANFAWVGNDPDEWDNLTDESVLAAENRDNARAVIEAALKERGE